MYAYQDPAVIDRIARIILNAGTAGASNADRSEIEPGTARTPKGSAVSEVGRAA